MLISNEVKLNYNDLLIVPQRSELTSRNDVDLIREYKFPHCDQTLKCTGVIASNMYNTGTIKMAYTLSEFNLLTALHKFHNFDDLVNLFNNPIVDGKFFITIGESLQDLEKFIRLYNHIGSKAHNRLMVCIDVANAYRTSFIDFVKKFRDIFPSTLLMAGNVTTPERTQELILAGVDIVKIGIGPGSACETRKVTGVGYPMASACIECADAAHGVKGRICADGGCRNVGDICKAFCLEADFVMIAGMLAGADECDGEWIDVGYRDIDWEWSAANPNGPGIQYKWFSKKQLKFFGMSSYEAMEKFGGNEKEYRASEGSVKLIDSKGPAGNIAKEILGGLRSCCSYLGASSLKEMPRRASFVRVSK